MATIQNARDVLLQAAPVRVVPPAPLQIGDIVGLPGRLDGIDQGLSSLGSEVNHLMNTSGDLQIRVSTTTLTNSNSVTLTVVRKNGLTGAVLWSLFAGSAIYSSSGDSCTIAGADVTSASITVKAAIGAKEAYATITKLGGLAAADQVDLTTQVVGQLASGKVTGLGALALLNSVDLNTQTIGALNALTQVSGLGGLAYLSQVQAGTSQVSGFGALAQKDKASAAADVTGLGALALKSTAAAGTDVTGLGALATKDKAVAGIDVTGLGALAAKNTASASSDVTGLGALALQSQVNLGSQVTGRLVAGNVSGLGSLATQSSVNGYTQVTNLGNLAYANAIAANQVGAGTLAAGVIYAGNIAANQITTGTLGANVVYAGSISATQITTGTISADRVSGGTFDNSIIYTRYFESDSSIILGLRGGSTAPRVSLNFTRSAFTYSTAQSAVTISNTGSGAPLQLVSRSTLPTVAQGGICYHASYGVLFSDGVSWYYPALTRIS